jgi:hypothetical protein
MIAADASMTVKIFMNCLLFCPSFGPDENSTDKPAKSFGNFFEGFLRYVRIAIELQFGGCVYDAAGGQTDRTE